jgi:hypothetical protein
MSDIASIVSLVDGISVSDVEQFAAMFMYQGFSPDMVFQHLHKVKITKNISNVDFQNDIKIIVLMGAIMGNYNSNNSNKISTEGKDRGDQLMTKYDLQAGGIAGNKKAVNIPRVLSAFPILASKMTIKVSPREYSGVFSSQFLPAFFKTPVSPSLIPRGFPQNIKTFLMSMCNAYLTEQTMAIRNMSGPKEAYNLQYKFTEISFKSPVPSEEERSQYIKKITMNYDDMEKVLKIINETFTSTAGALLMPSRAALQKTGIQIV